jgi:hypothetical protein
MFTDLILYYFFCLSFVFIFLVYFMFLRFLWNVGIFCVSMLSLKFWYTFCFCVVFEILVYFVFLRCLGNFGILCVSALSLKFWYILYFWVVSEILVYFVFLFCRWNFLNGCSGSTLIINILLLSTLLLINSYKVSYIRKIDNSLKRQEARITSRNILPNIKILKRNAGTKMSRKEMKRLI